MKKRVVLLIFFSFISFLLSEEILLREILSSVNMSVIREEYRSHQLNNTIIEDLKKLPENKRGEKVAEFLIYQSLPERFQKIDIRHYIEQPKLEEYYSYCASIWNEIEYFPVPASTLHKQYTISYVDTWNAERNFGGERGHEGVDLIASKNQPGLYPIVSMTDGIVSHKGWLSLGGWRVGILTPSGSYFYYAHLDSYADIDVGDEIEAGEIIGFMGDSGYGEEGTTGMFVTHLHLGIYIYPEGKEISINPYWILKLAEEKKLFCSY